MRVVKLLEDIPARDGEHYGTGRAVGFGREMPDDEVLVSNAASFDLYTGEVVVAVTCGAHLVAIPLRL
jgi:hypothetical protein